MRSSRTSRAWVLGGLLVSLAARAQTPVQGFDAERFAPSAPGAGWFVMDSLDMQGRLGGVLSFSSRYARDPLRVNGTAVVTDSAYAQIAGAVTLGSWRFSASFDLPLVLKGRTATIDGYRYTGPDLDLGTNPDTISDVQVGIDTRLIGEATGPFRLGLGARLWIPSGKTDDYLTDGTYRGMVRLLFAGDVSWLAYAGHLGVHIRPRDDGGVPGAPRGSELLFGAAAGVKLPLGEESRAVLGPEVYGATAFAGIFKSETTSAEALVSARWEQTGEMGPWFRVKLGAGLGLGSSFGSPAWRVVLAIEVFDRTTEQVRETEVSPDLARWRR